MNFLAHHHEIVAVFIVRMFLGLLFIFQGYDALFNIKVKNVIETYENSLLHKGVPRFLIVSGSWFSSLVEFVGGLFLVAGFLEYFTLTFLGVNLLIVSVAFGLMSPMWDMKFFFPRLLSLIFLLVVPSEWHAWSLDNLIFTLKHI